MTTNQPQKGEGFPGQRIVVLPRSVIAHARENPLLRGLLPTDVGYFPHASGHLRERPEGVDQTIFIYCVQGAGWCEMNGRRFSLGAGELLVIPPNTPHVYAAEAKRAWTIHWFHATGNFLPAYLVELNASLDGPVIYLGDETQLLALHEEVLDVMEHGYMPVHLLQASHALGHLISVMIRCGKETWREEPDARQKIPQSIAFMRLQLAKPLRVEKLAALANLSSAHYSSLFKQETGYSPIDYFIRLRMHRACQLLDTTGHSVKAISNLVGYEDPLYFSRVFHAINDISPTQYRLTRKG